MRKGLQTLFIWLAFFPIAWAQVSINGYRHAYILQPSNDSWGLYGILYDSIRASGMDAITDASNISDEERVRTCIVKMNTWGDLTQYARITVVDATTNTIIKEASEWARMHVGVRACAIAAVQQTWKTIGYKGYSEEVFKNNLDKLYPSRPSIDITIEKIKEKSFQNPIEGIWNDSDNKYTIGIIKDPTSKYADYIGIVLKSSAPTWKNGEIKFEFNETAGSGAYTGNAYLFNKTRLGTAFIIENNGAILRHELPGPNNSTIRSVWVKTYPKLATAASPGGPSSGVKWTGSGFLLSEAGLVATNHHVAGPATSLKVSFPKAGKEFTAKLVLKDPNNDLAILQIEGFSLAAINQLALPYGFKRTRGVSLGDPIFTIGYPLSSVLGQNAKFANGTISSKSGMGDDMVHLQINAPIQPGNSGSPLFDERGNVIGIVVASLNAEWMRQRFGSIPQNVNYAVKMDYLLNLADMLPSTIKLDEAKQKASPEGIEPFVCLISAQ